MSVHHKVRPIVCTARRCCPRRAGRAQSGPSPRPNTACASRRMSRTALLERRRNNAPREAAGQSGRGGAAIIHGPLPDFGEGREMYGAGALCGGSTGGLCLSNITRRAAVRYRPSTVKKMLSHSAPPYRRNEAGQPGRRSPASSTIRSGGHGSRRAAQAASHGARSSSGCGTRRVHRRLYHREGLMCVPGGNRRRRAFVPLTRRAMPRSTSARRSCASSTRKVAFFCPILPHSKVWLVKAKLSSGDDRGLPDGHVSAFAFRRGCTIVLSRIPQMDCQFDDLLGRFCYKNQCNTIIATGQTRLTLRVTQESSLCGSISTAA